MQGQVDRMQAQVRQQVTSVKEQAQKIVNNYAEENKGLVTKYNDLVKSYNELVAEHKNIISKYNLLVDEVRDPSSANFLAAKAQQIYKHPGIEGAVNKTITHVLPKAQIQLNAAQQSGLELFDKINASVKSFLEENLPQLIGDANQDWVGMASGMIVYGSVGIPLSIACYCVLEFVCRLQQLILFGHIYLGMTGLVLAAIAISTDSDPLSTFAEKDPSLYLFAQCTFALLFVAYGGVTIMSYMCTSRDSSWRFLNLLVILCFGGMYYILVRTPAMLDEAPKVDDFVESLYMPESLVDAPAKANTNADEVPVLLTATPYAVIGVLFSVLFFCEGNDKQAKGKPPGNEVRPEEDPEAKGD